MSQSRLRVQAVLTYLFLREQNHISRPRAANDGERFVVVRPIITENAVGE
ncbi:hypothetical protein BH24ACI1_BH24ACI1_27860 [soil metagenome]|jgi:hypothetical protein|nr:hypothetical protein [Pyrinomonadaceae bacterium]